MCQRIIVCMQRYGGRIITVICIRFLLSTKKTSGFLYYNIHISTFSIQLHGTSKSIRAAEPFYIS